MPRAHNFNAGPAALPLSVLEEAQRTLLDFDGSGMSILEVSHRSSTYEKVHNQTISDLKTLLGAGEEWQVLFMGGGAATQFALLPTNLLPAGSFAQYVLTGHWAEAALAEARKLGDVRELWTSGPTHQHVPANGEVVPDPKSAYVHWTSNNTIYGTELPNDEILSGGPAVVCDMSSDILSRPINLAPYSMIYAGAQKNLGPAGVTVVLIRKELLERCRKDVASIWSYPKIAAANSLQNTPPCFAIYLIGLVAKQLLASGGVAAVAARNHEKAQLLYSAIDNSDGYYRGHARPDSRSRMNVTWRMVNEELEAKFAKEATAAGLIGLKGHRSVGGLRASLYNAVTLDSVTALVGFMKQFQQRNGAGNAS